MEHTFNGILSVVNIRLLRVMSLGLVIKWNKVVAQAYYPAG